MNDYLKQWVVKADNDMKTAGHELNLGEDEAVTDSVCFHCQQAVEKLLKAFLVMNAADFGRTHNLEILVRHCAELDSSFLDLDVGTLSEYAVSVRYPDDFYIPDFEEAQTAYRLARDISDFVKSKLNLGD